MALAKATELCATTSSCVIFARRVFVCSSAAHRRRFVVLGLFFRQHLGTPQESATVLSDSST